PVEVPAGDAERETGRRVLHRRGALPFAMTRAAGVGSGAMGDRHGDALSGIGRTGWDALLRDLVMTPSHRGVERQEEATVRVLERYLRLHGLSPKIVEVVPGRPNLLCTVSGASPGRTLVLCGHTDTVPL